MGVIHFNRKFLIGPLLACAFLGVTLFADEEEETQSASPDQSPAQVIEAEGRESVYILPVQGQINTPTLYILRRGLRLAEANGIDTVVIDMNTPGGALNSTLEIMEALDSFKGEVFTFVGSEAMSAGAYISVATDKIFFAPDVIIGAAEAISGTGQDIPEGVQRKLNSYIQAKVRLLTEEYRYRSDVMRAMSDPNFELEIDGQVLKKEGELLSLTAREAMKEYGDPPQALLGAGIFDSIDDLLDSEFGPGNYEIRSFEVTWSESLAHWLNTISPLLLGAGMLLLFVEFKTPGFGFFGIGGIILLAIVFVSSHVAGLAGYESILLFFLGVALVLLEILLLPGLIFPAVLGVALILGSLIWAMSDIWPDEPIDWSGETFAAPLLDLSLGMAIAIVGALFLIRFLPKTWVWNRLVLQTAVGDAPGRVPEYPASEGSHTHSPSAAPQGWPAVGSVGVAATDFFPHGEIEIDGNRYPARSRLGPVDRGAKLSVTGYQDFSLTVEPHRR